MSHYFHLCPDCEGDMMDDIPCSNCRYSPAQSCREVLEVSLEDWQRELMGACRQSGMNKLTEVFMQNTEKSGGTRFSGNKPGGWWYAPLYGLRLVAEVWEKGAVKYSPMDWRNGQSFSTLMDCAFRHMMAMNMEGPLARDPESGAYHAAHACWNLLALLTFIALGRFDLDDVTGWQTVTTAAKDRQRYSFASPPLSPAMDKEKANDIPDYNGDSSTVVEPDEPCNCILCRTCGPVQRGDSHEL